MQEDATATMSSGSEALDLYPNIVFDGCEDPVSGFRYACSTCDNFDLCVRCEAKMINPKHIMFCIPVPLLVCLISGRYVVNYE